jgi:hypothetical protein
MNVKMESNSLFMMLGLAVAFLSLSMMEQKDESKNKEDEN